MKIHKCLALAFLVFAAARSVAGDRDSPCLRTRDDTLRIAEVLASAANTSSATATPRSSSAVYRVEGHRISLVEEENGCWLVHSAVQSAPQKLKLDLRPPCYVLTWQAPPPQRRSPQSVSDGVPIGKIGDPVAWRYRSANGVIAVGVIGDEVPADMRLSKLFKDRAQQKYRCAASMQGVLLLGNKPRLSNKRANAALFCVEAQVDEKDFWLLAH